MHNPKCNIVIVLFEFGLILDAEKIISMSGSILLMSPRAYIDIWDNYYLLPKLQLQDESIGNRIESHIKLYAFRCNICN